VSGLFRNQALGLLLLAGPTGAAVTIIPELGPFEGTCQIGAAHGDTTAARDALVDLARDDFSAFDRAAGPATGTVAPFAMTTGLAAQADGGYRLPTGGVLGLRLGALYALAGNDLEATNQAGDRLTESWALDVVMVPVLLGGWIERALSTDISLRGSVFAGPAFGKAILVNDWKVSGPSFDPAAGGYQAAYRATTFAADLGAEFDWQATRHLTLVLGAGYRLCRFVALRSSGDVDLDQDGAADIRAGDALQDRQGRPVPFNFSGFKGTVGLRWRFDRPPAPTPRPRDAGP